MHGDEIKFTLKQFQHVSV